MILRTGLRALFQSLCVVGLLLAGTSPARAAEPQMVVHFIDVGQGAATLLEFPCGAILIDTGAQDNDATTHLANYLKAFFDRRTDLNKTLNALIISHPHVDHSRGVETVLNSCRVRTYIDNGMVSGSGKAGVKYARDHKVDMNLEIVEIDDARITALPEKTGLTDDKIDSLKCADCDPQIRILSGALAANPGWLDGDFDNLNNHSVVVRVDFGESSFLFTGDLEDPALRTLVDYYEGTGMLDVDVYLVGHHGSHNGTIPEFVTEMTPDVAVMGVGKSTFGKGKPRGFNTFSYGHPRRDIVNLLSNSIPGFRSRAIDVEVADSARHFSNYRVTHRIYATGWDGDVTVAARLDGKLRVTTHSVDDATHPFAAAATRPPDLSASTSADSPSAAPPPPQPYQWNNVIPEKRPANGGNGKLILFDESHGGTAGASDWVIDGGFSDFADALVQAGYTCRAYRGIDKNGDGTIRFFDDRQHNLEADNEAVIEFSAIKDADVFVMAETNRPLRKDERDALLQFVASGKGLYFIADHYNADRNLNSWDATEVFNGYNRSTSHQFDIGGLYGDMRNPGDAAKGWLAENFGLRFRFNAIDCKHGVSDVVPPAEAEQLTTGVAPILVAAGSTLAIVDPAKAKGLVYLKTGDPVTSWANAVEGRTGGLYFGGKKEGPVVAISKPNKGKAAFIGDSSPIEDKSPKYRNELNGKPKNSHNGWNDPGTAAKLSLNIIEWLVKSEDYVGFDGTNGHAKGEATPEPLAAVEEEDPDDGATWAVRPGGYNPWDTDTYAPGSLGAPFPLPSSGGGGPIVGGGGGAGGGTNPGSGTTVANALHSPDGTRVTVDGIIMGVLNDEFGLKLGDTVGATNFLCVQLPSNLRAEFSPARKPDVRGKKIRIVGKRGRYTGLPGLKSVESITLIGP